MLRKDPTNGQFDFFIPSYTSDELRLRDQRETMERPFFALTKRKRLKPIEYKSDDGAVWVQVIGTQEHGIATIWDADVLIWAASVLTKMKNDKVNDLPRTLHFHPYDLLKAIGRGTSGRDYKELQAALDRLKFTGIKTNIRSGKRKAGGAEGWLDSWKFNETDSTGKSTSMHITLSDWIYEGIVQAGGVLSLDREYFLLTGGLERAIYRIARKHAGEQPDGFYCTIPTLHAKTGSDSNPHKFAHLLRKIIERNALPSYHLEIVQTKEGKTDAVKMIHRKHLCKKV